MRTFCLDRVEATRVYTNVMTLRPHMSDSCTLKCKLDIDKGARRTLKTGKDRTRQREKAGQTSEDRKRPEKDIGRSRNLSCRKRDSDSERGQTDVKGKNERQEERKS